MTNPSDAHSSGAHSSGAHSRDGNRRARRLQPQYTILVQNSPYCIHEIDHMGRISSMNPAGLRMMGDMEESEIIGMPYLETVSDDDRPRIAKLLEAAFRGEFAEYEFTAANGKVFRSNFAPLPLVKGKPRRIMGITQDISEQRRLERQLYESQRLDALGRLAGGVAHDFNNLLTVILGSAEMLREKRGCNSDDEAMAIQDAAQRAAELTSQLLSFARQQIVAPKRVDMGIHLREAEGLIRRLLPENIELVTDWSEGAIMIDIDPGQFDRVIMNLAVNASDAMPDGGQLTIKSRCVNIDGQEATPSAQGDVRLFGQIKISDTGCGIPLGALEHIFEPFFSTKDREHGTGLGLATSHGIVMQAKGSIEVHSSNENGTTFVIHLPLSSDSTRPKKRPLAGPADPCQGTILLVEDDVSVRKVVARFLRKNGLVILEAESAEEALCLLSSLSVHVDLLITDVVLSGMNGRTLAERWRAKCETTQILFTSGYTGDTVLRQGIQTEKVNFIAKPFSLSSLMTQVSELLAVK